MGSKKCILGAVLVLVLVMLLVVLLVVVSKWSPSGQQVVSQYVHVTFLER